MELNCDLGEMHKYLLTRLRCPDCLCLSMKLLGDSATCTQCGRTLQYLNGILDALPRAMSTQTESNREHYDAFAEQQEDHLSRRARTRNHAHKMAMLRQVLDTPGSPWHTLEIGIGSGAHSAELAARGHCVAGVDISRGLLLKAQRQFPVLRKAFLAAADATRLPFQEGLFDRVFCVATLHHLPEPERGVQEMVRVLKPGGLFCIVEPKRFYPVHCINSLIHSKTECGTFKMRIRSVVAWAQNAGAAAVTVEHFVFTPNRPHIFTPIYDRIDRICRSRRMLRHASVMFCAHGCKEEN